LSNAIGTAMFCLFMDKTFDSVNSRTINPESGKLLRSAVKENSPHVHHWTSAINTFQSMKLVNKSNGKKTVPPCLKNWIITLKSVKYLWSKLQNNNFKFFLTRHVNQDPLECLFGSVRSHGIRNTKPDCYQFHCSLKTLLINNFTSIKSAGNCEHDESGEALDNLKQFVESGQNLPKSPKSAHENESNFPIYNPIETVYDVHVSPISDMTIGYVSGYLARSVIKEFKFYKLCKFELTSVDKNNPLTRIRDFTQKSLMHPSKKFQQLIEQMIFMTNFILPKLNQYHIGQKLILMFESIDFPLHCPKHNLKICIYQKVKNLFIFTYLKNINRILKGIDRQTYDNSDTLKRAAHVYFLKHNSKR